MKIFTVTKGSFLNWYFNSGADQDQMDTIRDLGNQVMQEIMETGKCTITAEELFEQCERTVIPLNITEQYDPEDEYYDQELGELEEEWELKMVDDK